jgi:hypothetical protein
MNLLDGGGQVGHEQSEVLGRPVGGIALFERDSIDPFLLEITGFGEDEAGNHDGFGDILWRDTGGNVAIWLMKGTQVLNSPFVGDVATTWTIVGTGDFNGDGYADVLWRDPGGNVAIWEMNGTTVLNPNAAGVGDVPTIWAIQDPLGR